MRISDWSSDVCSSDLDCIERRQQLAIDARRQHRCVLCGGCRLRRNRHSPKANVIHKTPQHLSCHQTSPTKICLHVCHVAQQSILQVRNRRSEEHTSELQSLMRISYAVFCLTKKNNNKEQTTH